MSETNLKIVNDAPFARDLLSEAIFQIKEGKPAPVYLIFGVDEVKVKEAVHKLSAELLPEAALRESNYSEFSGKSAQSLKAQELINLCETMPFLAPCRVVVVENSVYLIESRKLTKNLIKERDLLVKYIEKGINPTTNLIFTFIEDEEKNKKVDTRGKLYKIIEKKGIVIEFRVSPVIFELIDALAEKNCQKALISLKNLLISNTDVLEIFQAIVKKIRFLLQAHLIENKVLKRKIIQKINLMNYKEFQKFYADLVNDQNFHSISGARELSLLKQHPYTIYKTFKQAQNWTNTQLKSALSDLVELEVQLRPRTTDIIAINPQSALECYLVKWCTSSKKIAAFTD